MGVGVHGNQLVAQLLRGVVAQLLEAEGVGDGVGGVDGGGWVGWARGGMAFSSSGVLLEAGGAAEEGRAGKSGWVNERGQKETCSRPTSRPTFIHDEDDLTWDLSLFRTIKCSLRLEEASMHVCHWL